MEDLGREHQVLGFSEIWLAPGEFVELKNFECLESKTNIRKATKGRHPGGVSLYVSEKIKSIFLKPKLSSGSMIGTTWIILNINNEFKIGICGVYNPPRESDYAIEEFFDELGNQLVEIEVKYNCNKFLIGGDFNSRIGTWQNSFTAEDKEDWEPDSLGLCLPERKSSDRANNANGRDLKQFCETHNLAVLNGATDKMDDFFTFISGTGGKSTIDLVLSSASLFSRVKSLVVKDSVLSHHLPVSVNISVPLKSSIDTTFNSEKSKKIKLKNYKWNKSDQKLEMISSKMNQLHYLFLPAIIFFSISNNIVEAIKVLVNLFTTICHYFRIKPVQINDVKKKFKCPWFNNNCLEAKKSVLKALKELRKKRNDLDVVEDFLKSKRKYNEIKTQTKKSYWEEKSKEILKICQTADPSKIWKEIKKYTVNFKPSQIEKISSHKWLEHFDGILNKKPVNNPEWDLTDKPDNHDDIFETPIQDSEVSWALRKIKHGKATGPDGVLGDFLKFFHNLLLPALTSLFDSVWQAGLFPREWARSIIVPLHKKGSQLLPNNYRGIALLSHVGKLLTRILNKRLVCWIERKKLLSECQAGFRKGFSTLDNIFVLDTIIQERLSHKNRPLYACFIDIKKCFDFIDRGALFYKLYKNGLPKKMLNLLRDYYSKSEFAIRLNSTERTIYKKSISGVFQGCQLSPQLFTLFINDVVEFLAGDENHAPEILGTSIHSLLYADDIVLLSCSPVGLQRMLNKLSAYCKLWELEVSLEKTKVVVFKKGRKLNRAEKWTYRNQKIEVLPEYKYLGVIFSGSGSWSKHIDQAKIKADKACTALLKFLFKFRFLKISFFLKIYDAMVVPILMYGSEVWGGHLLSEKGASALESTALRFYKSLLGISKGAPSTGVLLELNRLKMKEQMIINIIRYWLRISSFPPSRLVSICLRKQKQMAEEGKQCWALQVKKALDCLGLSFFWDRTDNLNKKRAIAIIKERVKDISHVTLLEQAKEKPSLSVYVQYKSQVEPFQKYNFLKPEERRWLAIIRLNLKRSLPIIEQNGVLICQVCQSQIKETNEKWKHIFIQGCTITSSSTFSDQDSYNDVVKFAIENPKLFIEKNNFVIKRLSATPRGQAKKGEAAPR